MRRKRGLRGGSIAEPQGFEAERSPPAAAEGRRLPDVEIHRLEVRQLLLTPAQERRRIRHHPYVAMAEHRRPPEEGSFAYHAARYSWQTPKLRHAHRLSSRTASIESEAILSPKRDRAAQNVVSAVPASYLCRDTAVGTNTS
jgi:hypothetical protein